MHQLQNYEATTLAYDNKAHDHEYLSQRYGHTSYVRDASYGADGSWRFLAVSRSIT